MPINPNLDYSKLLAQMVAQSRPTFPNVGGGRGGVIGGHGDIGTSKSTSVGVSASGIMTVIDSIQKLLGYKSDEEVEKVIEGWYKTAGEEALLNDPMVEKRREITEASPLMQTILKRGAKYGSRYVRETTPEERITPYGEKRYTLARSVPSKETQMSATFAGLPKATKEREVTRPVSEVEAKAGIGVTGEQRGKLIEAEKEVKTAMHPKELELKGREITLADENIKAVRERIKLTGQELTNSIKEHDAKMKEYELREQQIKLETTKTQKELEILKATMPKLDRDSIISLDNLFSKVKTQYYTYRANKPNDEATAFKGLAILEGGMQDYISGVRATIRDPEAAWRAAEVPVRSWAYDVDREFERPTLKGRSQVLGVGIPWTSGAEEKKGEQAASEESAQKQRSYRRYYFKAGVEMLRQSNTKSGDLYEKVLRWGLKGGATDEEIYGRFKELGFTDTQITNMSNKVRQGGI